MIVRPRKAEDRQTLMDGIGTDYWVYNGTPIRDKIIGGHTEYPLDVWVFEWEQISEIAQNQMIRRYMAQYHVGKAEARNQLSETSHCILYDAVELIDDGN